MALFPEMQELFCRVGCAWTGVPLPHQEAAPRAQDFWKMVVAFGALTLLRHLRGILARRRAERWLRHIVTRVCEGEFHSGLHRRYTYSRHTAPGTGA